ncbi:MAG: FAD-binding oxidoreductase [Deltaproteobacteria bacterium]|nr:FAD-binding oxidoreductase [Deltaproteobacteria bacterium]
MAAWPSGWERALDRLRDALGRDRILEGAPAIHEIRRRSLNPADDAALRCLLRPQSSEECRIAIEVLGEAGCRPRPIGALTTFWEPAHPLDAAIGLDTLALRIPDRIDVRERVGYFGAGTTVREVDRAARAQGLCLMAYPDSDGSAPVGSMAAMACTSGLGMARLSPVEQIVGLTIVTPEARIVRTGASWRLGRGGIAHGLPDPTGMFLGSQGRFGVITEVVLTLASAPFLAARVWRTPWHPPGEIADALRRTRREMDDGAIDSIRLEAVAPGGTEPAALEWFVRCWAPDSGASADARAAEAADRLGARAARGWVESAAGRRGELPDHDARYSLPPGAHHERTGQAGFLGIEVNVNWGEHLEGTLDVFAGLFAALRALPLGHARLGIYPAPHTVSIGAHAMLTGGSATPDVVRDAMAAFIEPLNALGALPYRPGRLWRGVMDHRERADPACELLRRAGLSWRPS